MATKQKSTPFLVALSMSFKLLRIQQRFGEANLSPRTAR